MIFFIFFKKLDSLSSRAAKSNLIEQQSDIERSWSVLKERMGDRGSKLELEKAKLQFHHQKQEFKEQLAELASRIEHSHEPENDAQVQRQIKNTNNIQGSIFYSTSTLTGLDKLNAHAGGWSQQRAFSFNLPYSDLFWIFG